MRHLRLHLLFLLFISTFTEVAARDFTPIVKQFGKTDYMAANQNWSVTQDRAGIMYFGNNLGLLQFDGSVWELTRMPQNKLVRSVSASDDGRIYVGSFEEFGFFERKPNGVLEYTSLSAQLKDYMMTNDEIWTITQIGSKVIFQSFTSYFIYENSTVKGIVNLFIPLQSGNFVFLHQLSKGLCLL